MNPKLPTELKKLRGTLNVTREKQNPNADTILKTTPLITDKKKFTCPKTITDTYCRRYWEKLTTGLLSIGVLSEADLPEVEQLILVLQKLREVQTVFAGLDVFDEDFDLWEKRYIRLSNKFSELGAKYYISPSARSKIKLEDLTIKEKEITVANKTESAINNLLNARIEGA